MADAQRRRWTADEYHASDAVSRSKISDYETDPALYRDVHVTRTRPAPAPSAAMKRGTLLHLAVLEPHEWAAYREDLARRLVDKPEFTGTGAKSRERAWRERLAPDARPVTEKQREEVESEVLLIKRMARAILEPRTDAARCARAIVDQSEREVTYTWTDVDPELRAGPMVCRARLDLLRVTSTAAYITDLKTSTDPSPRAFQRAIGKFRYHWQAPFYSAPVLETTGFVPQFAFIVVRSAPSFQVAVYQLRPEHIAAADAQVRHALRRLSESLATNTWAAHWETRPDFIDVPGWALRESA